MARSPKVTDAEVRDAIKDMLGDSKKVNPGALVLHFGTGRADRYKRIIAEMADEALIREKQESSLSAILLPEELQRELDLLLENFHAQITTAYLRSYENALVISSEKADDLEQALKKVREEHAATETDYIDALHITDDKLMESETELVAKNKMLETLLSTVSKQTGQIESLTSTISQLHQQVLLGARPDVGIIERILAQVPYRSIPLGEDRSFSDNQAE